MSQQIKLAWGARVSPAFRMRVIEVAANVRVDPSHLMSGMAFETGETFSPSVRNGAGSGATGLIQFMPATALGFFYSVQQIEKMSGEERRAKGIECTSRLAAMSAVLQLSYVERYFMPYRGRLRSLGDLYMAILWPAGIGKSDDTVLFDRDHPARPKLFKQNAGLDYDSNGQVTRGEAIAKVMAKLDKGLLPANVAIMGALP